MAPSDTQASERRAPQDRLQRSVGWRGWLVVAAVAAPIGILLHELGHYLAARAFGFADAVLHFGSVTSVSAEAEATAWQRAIQFGAGPAVTLALLAISCFATARFGARATTTAPGFAVGVRSAILGFAYLAARLRGPADNGSFDELNVARALGLPIDLVMLGTVGLLLGGWLFLILAIAPGKRIAAVGAAAAGTALGLLIYVGWLGPLILP